MSDWASQAADGVEKVVVLVRDRTVAPAQKVSRGIVYGLLALAFLVPALIFVTILVFRALTYIPGGGAWLAYLILGGICILGGALCWSKRGPRLDLRD